MSLRLWCTDKQWFDNWTWGEAYESFQWPHNHSPQVPFSLSVQSSILPLFISPEEEILLPSWLLGILICYKKTHQKITLKEKRNQEYFCNALFINFTCHAWVRVNNTTDEEKCKHDGTDLWIFPSLSCGDLLCLIPLSFFLFSFLQSK